jgi:septal ring factor EnvC (AmiA/AmiB activator)
VKRAGLLFGAGALALSGALVFGQGAATVPPMAPRPSSIDERLKQVQERKAVLERDLLRLRGQEKSLLGEVEALELGVRLREQELQQSRLVAQRTQAELDLTLKRVKELEKSLDEARPFLVTHARALYKLGDLSYVRMLLSVDKPSDIFRGYRFVSTLARRDHERVARFRSDLADLATERGALEQRSRASLAQRAELEQARRNLDTDRRRKTELLTSLVAKKEVHAAFVQELQDAEEKLRQLLEGTGDGDVAVPLSAFRGALPWPTAGRVRTSFGRHKHQHFETYTVQNGIELDSTENAPVVAVYQGTVAFAEHFKGYGLMVVLDHGGKHHTLYAHLAQASVEVGQKVAAGDVLGTASEGGEGTGLYFEVRFQGRPEDPLDWLKKAER